MFAPARVFVACPTTSNLLKYAVYINVPIWKILYTYAPIHMKYTQNRLHFGIKYPKKQ